MKPIRVLIADDHAVVRAGIRMFLDTKSRIELVGDAVDGVEAVIKCKELKPDVLLLDLVMPRMGGIEAIREIKRESPKVRILVLTSFAEEDKVFPAIKAGALGYLLKDSQPSELIQAIYDVYQGRPSLHPRIALKLMEELYKPSDFPLTEEPLTVREVEVLRLVARGLSNQEIGDQLVITERTVRRHMSNILDKLHLANRTQAALYALRKGFADLPKDR